MTPVRQKLAAHARARREQYIQITMDFIDAEVLSRRDVEQMIDGFLALLTEGLTSSSTEIRTFYLETVIPGLIGSGTPASGIIGGVVRFAIQISIDAVGALAPEERDEGTRWFATFFNDYIADMVRVAEESK